MQSLNPRLMSSMMYITMNLGTKRIGTVRSRNWVKLRKRTWVKAGRRKSLKTVLVALSNTTGISCNTQVIMSR